MKVFVIVSTAVLLTAGMLAAGSLSAPPAADSYQVDPIHSSMVFRVKHMNVANFYGRFNNISGSFTLDNDPSKCSFNVQIKTDNVDTGNTMRDQHLKSPDFFNAAQFPSISFKSTQVKKSGDEAYDVTGDMELHGVKKSVTAKVTKTGSGNMRGRQIAGAEAVLAVKRSDFGMTFALDSLGDEVQITMSLEGGKQ
jgi:polyisoprenoid-binding protein YceI